MRAECLKQRTSAIYPSINRTATINAYVATSQRGGIDITSKTHAAIATVIGLDMRPEIHMVSNKMSQDLRDTPCV